MTKQSVIIPKGEKLGLELTPRTRRFVQVRRDGNRVRISAGSGGAAESWSFVPPEDAAGGGGYPGSGQDEGGGVEPLKQRNGRPRVGRRGR